MGTHFQATACPLCGDDFDEPGAYRDHLAMMHDLVDDEGTETTLAEEPEPEPDPEPLRSTDPVMARSVDHDAVADPDAVLDALPARRPARPALDRHLVPGVAIVLAVQLLVGLLGLAVVGGDGDGDKRVATEAAASGASGGSAAANDRNAPGAPGAKDADNKAPATTAPPATIDTSHDQERADAINPRASDFPGAWEAIDPSELEGGDEGDSATDRCLVADDPSNDDTLPQAGTGLQHELSFVFGGTVVLRTERDAERTMSILRSQAACMGDAMAEDFASGAEGSGANVTHGTLTSMGFPVYGDESIAQSMQMTVSGPGGSIPIRLDMLAIRRDRACVLLFSFIASNDLTPAQERGAMSAIEARMAPKAI